jgi:uncharacterized membrane protein
MRKVEGKTFDEVFSFSQRTKRINSLIVLVVVVWLAFYFRTQGSSILGALGWSLLYVYGPIIAFAVSLGLLVMLIRIPFIFRRTPLWFQKPFYLKWRKELEQIQSHPLLDFPLQVYIRLKLDEDFLAGGLDHAMECLQNELKRLSTAVPDMLEKLVENNIAQKKFMENLPKPTCAPPEIQ